MQVAVDTDLGEFFAVIREYPPGGARHQFITALVSPQRGSTGKAALQHARCEGYKGDFARRVRTINDGPLANRLRDFIALGRHILR